MISSVDPSAAQFLADMALIQNRADRAQRQLSSGLKFTNASDAPDQVGDILQLRADLNRNSQVSSNLSSVKTTVDTAEQTLETVVTIVERAGVLAAQGATGAQTAQSRLAIAQEVRSIHQQLVGLSNTQVGARFVFGGDADQTAPYALDTVSPDAGGGVVQSTTAQATRRIQDPLGDTFGVDRTAQQIFDHQNPAGTPAADNVFAAVNQLRVALEANDTTGIQNSMDSLAHAGDYLNQQIGFYGAVQNRISAATDLSQKMALNFQTALSGKQDADLTQSILEINQTRIQEQAAFTARAQTRKTSLFDFMA
jgi:flagellar hook-associated protein 3 FlgL